MLLQTQSRPNHTFYINLYFNEFVANVLCGNIESKKSASILRKINAHRKIPVSGNCVIRGLGVAHRRTYVQ